MLDKDSNIAQSNNIPIEDDIQDKTEITDRWEEILNIKIPPKGELAEISEEEKAQLFFAPEYNPTVEEIETRKRNMEISGFESIPIDKATPENNIILKTETTRQEKAEEKAKTERIKQIGQKSLDTITYISGGVPPSSIKKINHLLETSYPSLENRTLIPRFYKEFQKYYKNKSDKPNQPIEEIVLKAIDRYEMIGGNEREEKNILVKILYTDPSRLTEWDIIKLGKTSDEKWNDSINVLKQIPYLTLDNMPDIDTICYGYSDIEKFLLKRLKDFPTFIVAKNSSHDSKEFYQGIVSVFNFKPHYREAGFRSGGLDVPTDQYIKAVGLYSGKHLGIPSKIDLDYALYALRFGNHDTSSSEGIKHLITRETHPKLIGKRIELIKNMSSKENKELYSNEKTDFFLSSLNNTNRYAKDLFTLLKSEDNFDKFLDKYTTIIDTESGNKRFFNDMFWTYISYYNQDFLLKNPAFLSKEVLSSLPEEKKLFWTSFLQMRDPEIKEHFFFLYLHKKLDTVEKINSCNDAVFQISNSPSRAVRRLQKDILFAILSGDKNAEQIQNEVQVIRDIFENNNSPTAVLRFKVFEHLYLNSLIKMRDSMSSVFLNILHNKEYDEETKKAAVSEIIRKDLLNIAKNSVDENLYNFLDKLRDGYEALTLYDNLVQEGFTDDGIINQLGENEKDFLLKSLDLFFTASSSASVNNESVSSRITELRKILEIHPNQPFSYGIYKNYINPMSEDKPTGDLYTDITKIMNDMLKRKEEAHQRGLEYAKTGITLKPGDLLKGVRSLSEMINNGIYAKDYLGADSKQDYTPYDTDVIKVELKTIFNLRSPISIVKSQRANEFGGITLVMRDRGQYSSNGTDGKPYELIHNNSERYNFQDYGIRTGVAITEIDWIYYESGDLNKLKFDIASKDIYIPVVNSTGNIIFTPEEFEKLRETFAGIKGLRGKPFEVEMKTEVITNALQTIHAEHKKYNEKTIRIGEYLENVIKRSVEKFGFELETSRSGLNGIRVEHTGSTARLTNTVGTNDYDFSILIPNNIFRRLNYSQIAELISNVEQSIGVVTKEENPYQTNGTIQLTGSRIKIDPVNIGTIQEEEIEFDMSIADKTGNLDGSNSHEYIIERLESIRETQGEEGYNFVVSNILFAKTFFKKFKCYKKGNQGQGGMGGIGVENWILQHNGNFEKAVDAFLTASKGMNGQPIAFEEFKERYTVYDPGSNIRSQSHDNFIADNMNASGYKKMIDAFTNFKENGITLEELRRR